MKIKVCGLKEAENIREIASMPVDYIGFIFHAGSPRHCGNVIGPFTLSLLPEGVTPVAVTVNEDETFILDLASRYGFDTFQLHGEESPEMCASLRSRGMKVIKAFGVMDASDFEKMKGYEGKADYFLFDTRSPQKGGSGKKFDWNLLKEYSGSVPFFLSGGIAPEDAEQIKKLSHPLLIGVDINSRFETDPGLKDVGLVSQFAAAVKKRDEAGNRLSQLFNSGKRDLLAVYFTAGFPKGDSTVEVLDALCAGGADIIEIGIPFSDPMADGVVIQHSSNVALENGMTLSRLLDQVEEGRSHNPDTPFVAMGYLNPIMQMGAEKFFKRAKEAGIDGVIIPDLPFDIYLAEYKELSRKYDIPVIMLITPATSEERIRLIDEHCDGFIYMVSTASTTGARDKFSPEAVEYFRKIDSMNLSHPRLIGFGISNADTYRDACRYSSGAIIGSQFIKLLETESSPAAAVEALMKKIGR